MPKKEKINFQLEKQKPTNQHEKRKPIKTPIKTIKRTFLKHQHSSPSETDLATATPPIRSFLRTRKKKEQESEYLPNTQASDPGSPAFGIKENTTHHMRYNNTKQLNNNNKNLTNKATQK